MKKIVFGLLVISTLMMSCERHEATTDANTLKQENLTATELALLEENGISVTKSNSIQDLANSWDFVGFLKSTDKNVVFEDQRSKEISATYTDFQTHNGNYRFSAIGPINTVNAEYYIDRERLFYTEINRTRISGKPEVIAFEDVFFANLLATSAIYTHHGFLILENPVTHMKMLFTAQ